MRLVVALLFLLVFAPAARADVNLTEGAAALVDATAPPAPTITAPVEGASLKQLAMTGTTTAGTTVAVLDGATELGQAVVTGEGWTFVTAGLAEGTHTLTVVATDATGSTPSSPVTIQIDRTEPPAPTIGSPTDGALSREPLITLSGAAEAGSTVAIRDGGTLVAGATTATGGGTWTLSPPALADGTHTFTAVATDAAGNASQDSAAVHVIVDTVAPEVTFSDVPASPTNQVTFDIGFGANEPAVTFDCVHVFPGDGGDDELPGCGSPFSMRDLTDGTHELRVTAKDLAGNTRTSSVFVTVDATAPDAVDPMQTGASEFSFAGEASAQYECRLAGPSIDTGFTPCGSPQAYPDLSPGDYAFSLQTIDAAGNRAAAPVTKAFSIAAIPAATPDPNPRAMPAPTPPPAVIAATPAAELGRTLVIRPVSGKVYIRRPATSALLELGAVAAVPVGTEVDARKGRVRVTAAATRGNAAHRAEFFGGMFTVTQAADDIVDLKLSEPFGSCAKKSGVRVRKLWGDGRGRFRMRGQNAVVTVRGTRWLVQDSCEGTLTRVSQGVVSVRDTVKRKTFLVRAGRKYLAVPKKRK